MCTVPKELSLYVHIPFCVKKCLYCDFLSFFAEEETIARYFEALIKEIRLSCGRYKDYDIKSVFFGGGTPSFPCEKYICKALNEIRENFTVKEDAEISMELNPGTATFEKLVAYRQAGIKRLSIGAQSLDDNELKTLGRIHDASTFYKTYDAARKAGFDNINIDLMSAIPDQNLKSYRDTLQKVIDLNPEHISAYSLIVEENTPFYDMELNLVSEDDERLMYHETKSLLQQHGYHRYEISNYAREGFECSHNKVYWQYGFYLGLGLGASSMVDYVRWSNTTDIKEYIRCSDHNNMPDLIRRDECALDTKDRMEEFMFMGLRMVSGVEFAAFKSLFGKDMYDIYSDTIEKYLKLGLLEKTDTHLRLTEMGMDVSNTVMADFLL